MVARVSIRAVDRSLIFVLVVCACRAAPVVDAGTGASSHASPVEPSVDVPAIPAVEEDGPFAITFVEFRNRSGPSVEQGVVFRVTNGSNQTAGCFAARISFIDATGERIPDPSVTDCVNRCGDESCKMRCRASHSWRGTSMMGDPFIIGPDETKEFVMRTTPIPEKAARAEMHITQAWEIRVKEEPPEMWRGPIVWGAPDGSF